MVRQTLDAFHRIDILINNAATNRPALFVRLSQKKWDEMKKKNSKLKASAGATSSALGKDLEQMGKDLKEGYERMKKVLR